MLNHAASLLRILTFAAAATMLASSATALDGIDLNEPLEPTGAGECPRLVQIKYPFLSCANGQIGQSDADETWENARQLPQQGAWNEGDGAWGPDQNQN
ncbi:MAG: hypothetical protein AAGC67_20685 [Myxococcota bacterium]